VRVKKSLGEQSESLKYFTEQRGFLAKGEQRLIFFCFFSLIKQRKEVAYKLSIFIKKEIVSPF
jgi:hypothetical protein